MKKVLALVVAFALCFTVFAGCFATSAADVAELTTFTVTSEAVAADAGAAKVTVTADLSTVKNVKLISVTLPDNVDFAKDNTVEGMEELTKDNDDGSYVISGKTIKFLEIQEVDGVAFVANINVTVPANVSEADVTYTVTAFIEYADFDYNYGTASAEGVVTVKAMHVHAAAADAAWQNDANNHWKVCAAHADVKVEEAAHTAGDAAVEDGYTVVRCSVCDYVISSVVVEPEVPECQTITSVAIGHTLAFDEKVVVNLLPTIDERFTNCEQLYIELVKDDYSTGTLVKKEPIRIDWTGVYYGVNQDRYFFQYTGLAIKELGDNFTSVLYGADAEGNVLYKSVEDVYSVSTYINNTLKKPASKETLKQLLADVAVYGAAAQINFNYRTDALVTAAPNEADLIDQYKAQNAYTASKVSSNGTEGLQYNLSNTLAFESSVYINYLVPTALYNSASDAMKLVVTHNSDVVTFSKSDFIMYNASYYFVSYDKLVAKEFTDDVVAVLKDGETQIANTRNYSVEAYATNINNKYLEDTSNTTRGLLNNVLKAMMNYSSSAINFLNN